MHELVISGIWPRIRKLADKSHHRRAAVAYVSSDRFVKFGAGDTLVTDASDQAIASGQTGAEVLAKAVRRGADVFSLPRLHAKVMLLDQVAVIGSANMSISSAYSLVEAVLLTDGPSVSGGVLSFIMNLARHGERVGEPFIRRILKIGVRRTPPKGGWKGKKPRQPISFKHRTWLIGVHEMADDAYPDEATYVNTGLARAEKMKRDADSDLTWVRFTSSSKFTREAKAGDHIVLIWKPLGRSRPSIVYRHELVLRRQVEPGRTRIFIERYSDSEDTAMTWSSFRRLARRVGITAHVSAGTTRLLPEDIADSLYQQWGDDTK